VSRKVIATNTDQSAVYDFLLKFYSNYGDFSRKSQIFPIPVYFAPTLKGVPSEIGIGTGGQNKTLS